VNNAGISTTESVDGQVALEIFDTNAIGIIRVTQAAIPLLERSENPVVVNVSSALGSFLGRHQSGATPVSLPLHHLRLEQSRRIDAHRSVAKALPKIKFNCG